MKARYWYICPYCGNRCLQDQDGKHLYHRHDCKEQHPEHGDTGYDGILGGRSE
jgi:hypothetical protein